MRCGISTAVHSRSVAHAVNIITVSVFKTVYQYTTVWFGPSAWSKRSLNKQETHL